MKLKNLQIRYHGKGPLQHRITYGNENGVACCETLNSGVKFAQHVIECLELTPKLIAERDELRKQRDGLFEQRDDLSKYAEALQEALQRIARVCGKTFFVDIGYYNLPELVEELLAQPTETQPTETQYVLHGDIQPCTVLYSDETTTLLRLPEGDVMCETDTVEWYDEVTYRCQELLREAGVRSLAHVAPKLADLVRDERITINDEPVFIVMRSSDLEG